MLAAYGIPYRVVIKDFRGKERVVFGEVPVVEDEQELHSVLQSLDGVRHAPRKVSSDCKATESFLKNKEGGGGVRDQILTEGRTRRRPCSRRR